MSEYLEHPKLPPTDYEDSDVSPRAFFRLLLAFGSIVVVSALLIWWIYPSSLQNEKMITGSVPRYPEPMLQPSPPTDMQTFFNEEMAYLYGTGWVDRARGTVHIPIDQAMRKVVEDGIPDWPSAAPSPGSNGANATPSAIPEGRR